jgi:hypothetical protein
VPTATVSQLVTYRPVTLAGTLTTTNGVDFEADSTWQASTLSGPSALIGSTATVTVTATVQLAPTITITNNGTVQITDGGNIWPPTGTPTWINAGTLAFTDTYGAELTIGYGRFINLPTGTVTKTGTAPTDTLTGNYATNEGIIENDGTITAANGNLSVGGGPGGSTTAPATGASNGLYTTTGTGHIDLTPYNNVTTTTTYGPNIWVTGTITGTINIPTGTTLNIGDDPTTTTPEKATLNAPTQGPGTLNIAGNPGYGGSYYAQIAADLNNTNVNITNATLTVKPDNTPTQIATGTTVALVTTPVLGPGLSLINNGTIDFGTNNYFTCTTTCTVSNVNRLVISNPDNSFGHTFDIAAGTFDNTGVIVKTGYYPGTDINFWASATVIHKGNAEVSNMSQPTRIRDIQSSSFIQTLTSAADLESVVTRVGMTLAAHFGNVGVGSCVNYNPSISVLGGSAGVCLVIDPNGTEVVAITVASGIGYSLSKASSRWDFGQIFNGFSYTLDGGLYVLWRTGAAGNTVFDATTDIDGPFECQNGSVAFGFGVTGQHCWGPADGVPFSLDTDIPLTTPGIHTAFVGFSTGAGISASLTGSYSVVLSCQTWNQNTLHAKCPPVNTVAPTITGTPAVNQTLTASTGSWAAGPTSFAYQWQRCTSSSQTTCTDVAGETTNQHLLTQADSGYYVTVVVTAVNDGGPTPAKPDTPVYIP